MVEKTTYEPGTFCWVELATKDGAAAKTFYTSLFGWVVDDMPIPDGSTFTMLQKNGKQVGENVGRFATLTDPEGARFAVIRLNAPAQ
jgi:predicted enzyme related to lactoylglutathione lyase